MSVNLQVPGELLAVRGVRLSASAAAIKSAGRDDLALLVFEPGTTVAGVFTQSGFRAPPVALAEQRIAAGGVAALVINSGNANAATGKAGLEDASRICDAVARSLELAPDAVAPFSTGVIGERLPVERMLPACQAAAGMLSEDAWHAAARAIMTTDTVPKAVSSTVVAGGHTVTITGIAKGSGMIRPDMATLLTFICCDAAIAQAPLATMVREVADASFNCISIDADTSTNDSFVLAATGIAGNPRIAERDADYAALAAGITDVATRLAQNIVRDGEGATKFVTVTVRGGATPAESRRVAYTIAESPLVKTALFAGDPNWGRLCMAIGRAGVEGLAQDTVDVYLDEVQVMRGGVMHPDYREEDGARVMAKEELEVRVELHRGAAGAVVWTSDLSYEYVKINAEYRT